MGDFLGCEMTVMGSWWESLCEITVLGFSELRLLESTGAVKTGKWDINY